MFSLISRIKKWFTAQCPGRLTGKLVKEDGREQIDFYTEENRAVDKTELISSLSGKYQLVIDYYSTTEGSWSYSRGRVKEVSNEEVIADIKRNYPRFWHTWAEHPNGNEYLLCGEDYQGYTVINLTEKKEQIYLPKQARKGWGFCWVSVEYLPDEVQLRVEGCYWACPYEVVVYDFSNPDRLPLPELERRYMTEEEYDEDEED